MRNFLFVLLLATGVALAEDAPKAKGAGSATEAQEKLKKEADGHAFLKGLIHAADGPVLKAVRVDRPA